MALSLLLVEDTKTIAESIKQYLELDGHSVTRVDHWSYANELVKHQNFDIVLLDLMLPWVDWITIAKTIRSVHPETPILMMTAKGQLDDKLEGFEAWADDYLVKPFDLEELEARVLALAKRLPKKEELSFDENMSIFEKLQKESQRLEELTRPLMTENTPDEEAGFEEDGKLDVYLSTIRRKIGKDRIETIKWFWYRMNK